MILSGGQEAYMDSVKPLIYIIIVNWNGWEDTVECLYSLEDLDCSNFRIVIVDNASTDNSVNEIQARFNDIILIENEINRGFAGGNNAGIVYAMNHDADYVWLLNNDTIVKPAAIKPMVARMNHQPEIGICGSKLIYYDQRDTIQALAGGTYSKWIGISHHIGQNKPVDAPISQTIVENKLQYIVGASMLVSRAFIDRVGLLNEDYFLYYEELDWAMRGKEKFALGFAPESVVYHKEGAATGGRRFESENRSKISDYYQLKNRLKFCYNHFPFYLPFIYITLVYAIINRMRRGQWDRVPMILKIFFSFNNSQRYQDI